MKLAHAHVAIVVAPPAGRIAALFATCSGSRMIQLHLPSEFCHSHVNLWVAFVYCYTRALLELGVHKGCNIYTVVEVEGGMGQGPAQLR